MAEIEKIINAEPSQEMQKIVSENARTRATWARKDLQKAFKTQAGIRMGSTKAPELYQIRRDEAFAIISELDSQVIRNISEHITTQSLLTNTLANRILRELLNITREQIQNLGEDQLNRLKAYKVISESINRSEATHRSRERRIAVAEENVWVDSEVRLDMENPQAQGTNESGRDPWEDEYEIDPTPYQPATQSSETNQYVEGAVSDRGRLQAVIDYSNPIVRVALEPVDLDLYDVILEEGRLIIRDLVAV